MVGQAIFQENGLRNPGRIQGAEKTTDEHIRKARENALIYLTVLILSLSSLAFEVLLARIFSISQWNHLSFMVISIALLGFGASGTCLSLIGHHQARKQSSGFSFNPVPIAVLLFSVCSVFSFLTVINMPLDYFKLPLEPQQALYLFIAFTLLALSFFFAGFVIAWAFSKYPQKSGWVYAASMSGSALGALIPFPCLRWFSEGSLVLVIVLLPLLVLPGYLSKSSSSNAGNRKKWKNESRINRFIFRLALSFIVIAGIAFGFTELRSFTVITPSEYKPLSQILKLPNTRLADTSSDLRGRIDRVRSDYIRYAPGISLKYAGGFPPQQAIYRDGDDQKILFSMSTASHIDFSSQTLSYLGYALADFKESALIIQENGGLAVPSVLSAGVKEITIVEKNPHIAAAFQHHYRLPVFNGNHRIFLSHSDKRYDIIHVENWGAAIPGSAALTQDYSYTIESFVEYLNHLNPGGFLIIARRLLLPPSDMIRMWASAYTGLKRTGRENPEKHMVVLRNWDTYTMLVSRRPIEKKKAILQFARQYNFDIVFMDDMSLNSVNRFNIFTDPFYYQEIDQLRRAYAAGEEDRFFSRYFLDVRPQTDHRPFPNRFLKWPKLKSLYQSTGSRLYTLLMSGEIVIAVLFMESCLIAVMLLIVPYLFSRKERMEIGWRQSLFFLSVGAGFMFMELFFIKHFILIFSDPIISFVVVLSVFLIFSGVGGFVSQRLKPFSLKYIILVLVMILIILLLAIDAVTQKALAYSPVTRFTIAAFILIPPSFLAGIPFPLGMRFLPKNELQRGYAWAANGCMSILASVASAQIALSHGLPQLLLCAIGAYAVPIFLMLKGRS
jgi:hypothetical protein